MKKMKVWNVYCDDGSFTFKAVIPAASKKDAIEYAAGNGEIVAIKENTDICIDLGTLADDLKRCNWGQAEIDVITRALSSVGIGE